MASRNAQTHAKRARELAVRERRERKRAKKAEAAAQRAAAAEGSYGEPGAPTDAADPDSDATVADPVTPSGDIDAGDAQAQAMPKTEERAFSTAGSDAKEEENGSG